jgi:hypothetical protein
MNGQDSPGALGFVLRSEQHHVSVVRKELTKLSGVRHVSAVRLASKAVVLLAEPVRNLDGEFWSLRSPTACEESDKYSEGRKAAAHSPQRIGRKAP